MHGATMGYYFTFTFNIIIKYISTVSELENNLYFLTIHTCSDITAIPFMGKSKACYKFPLVFILSFINDFCKHHHKITVANYVKIACSAQYKHLWNFVLLTHVWIGTKSHYCTLQYESYMVTKYHGFQFSVMWLQVVI